MKKLLLVTLCCGFTAVTFGQTESDETARTGLSFQPDYTFNGSSLGNWQSLGDVDWRAQNGEIIGSIKGTNGGLLILDHSFQDIGVHTAFKSSLDNEAGIVMRLEKTDDGLKGTLVSIKDGEVVFNSITFDKNGKELQRVELPPPTGYPLVRLVTAGDAPNKSNRNRERRSSNDSNLPLKRPDVSFHSNEWNQIEIAFDLNAVRVFMNDGSPNVGVAAETNDFGPIAFYASGSGEIRFKDFAYKDLAVRSVPLEATSSRFRVQRINDMYYSWGVGAADFNKDGALDIVAGPYIYFGPDFTNSREIYPASSYGPSKEFTDVNCQYTFDFNGDGWPDILTGPPIATLYLNPKGESRRWEKHVVVPGIQSEVTLFKDIDGSGIPALVYCKNGSVCYAKPDPADPTKPWIEHVVSEKGLALGHGLGVGDINGDGRPDILNPNGWWEQPAADADKKLWTFHPTAFARYGHRSWNAGGAAMAVYDVNGDDLNDVVTSLNAHGFGLAWFEQKRDASGNISFVRHMIMDDFSTTNAGDVTFSELHGSTSADIDGDGIPDFIVGKRYWSHLDSYFDPDPYDAPVLYVYRTVRDTSAPGGARFVPELIHNRSGAGSDVLAVDLNKDGRVDVVTSTDRGTFIFWNTGTNAVK